MNVRLVRLIAAGAVMIGAAGPSRAFSVPNTFQNGQVADANQVNANFAAVASTISAIEENREGAYNNRVPDIAAGQIDIPYNEVCFVTTAAIKVDNNSAFQGTAGGNCSPGDRGFVFFPSELSGRDWSEAVFYCTTQKARLPTLFEYQMACDALPVSAGLKNNWEWASGPLELVQYGQQQAFYGAPIIGGNATGTCRVADVGIAAPVPALGSQVTTTNPFHCVR